MLIGFTVFKPMATGGGYSEVAREQLLQAEDQWIVQFDIVNHEGEDKNYTINVLINSELSSKVFLVRDGHVFTYIHHIYHDRIIEPVVSFAIYEEGVDTPFETVTYHLEQ